YLSEVSTTPAQIAPGAEGTINMKLENIADTSLKDIRIELTLPAELAAYQDASRKKIDSLAAGSLTDVSFKIIAIPSAEEGVYKVPINFKYVNSIGDEKSENNTLSVSIGSSPQLIAELSSSEIYKGNSLGDIKIKVINNNVGNVKFLKVVLGESQNYKIIGTNLDYIGDLNSDDFSEVTFKLNVNDDKKLIILPITLNYKDSLNRDYTQQLSINFNVPSAKEAGIKTSSAGTFILLIIIVIAGVIVYRKYFRNTLKHNKRAVFDFKSKI
ncbi:MAG: hypothetical protein AABX17_04355, partial [Nanoarchaeota archaeon]